MPATDSKPAQGSPAQRPLSIQDVRNAIGRLMASERGQLTLGQFAAFINGDVIMLDVNGKLAIFTLLVSYLGEQPMMTQDEIHDALRANGGAL